MIHIIQGQYMEDCMYYDTCMLTTKLDSVLNDSSHPMYNIMTCLIPRSGRFRMPTFGTRTRHPMSFVPRAIRQFNSKIKRWWKVIFPTTVSDTCPGCNIAPHTIKHIIEDCTVHNHLRQQHNVHSLRALWERPVTAMSFLRNSGLFGQAG